MMSLEALRACVVLQDCADQLEVIGNIVQRRPITKHRATELNLQTSGRCLSAGSSLSDATEELHTSLQRLSINESPLTTDNLTKVQHERQFLSDVINGLLVELQKKNTFESLFSVLEEERKKKADLLDMINREKESRLRVKELQKQLLDIHAEKAEKCEALEELIAYLKVQIQDMRVRTGQQGKFVKSCAEQLVYEGQKTNSHKEKELEDEVRMLQEKNKEEKDVHMEMMTFLNRQHTSLQEKLQFWIQCYEKDLEEKEQEITALKNTRANKLAQLQELSKKCRDMQQVIIEDRMEKERLRVQLEKEQMERDAATKIQSWWRGTLVRKGLGSSKKGEKSKAKKGKKGKKKK
ncbi:dynein regulatory complex protein 9 [Myxocyprinus asiaticus]|uniref:dynein regulatory complex protein 9 n=1 Tax=Myxocyprinus asiaticus TaxID=70543 RepID=UPI002222BF98|nr:dynein regulatory complex protein 9 [Myxocyprinus asiaticus]